MIKRLLSTLALFSLVLMASPARADSYRATIDLFKEAGQSSHFFKHAYGYAVFPTIGKGGIGIGRAYGSGRVYSGQTRNTTQLKAPFASSILWTARRKLPARNGQMHPNLATGA